ncbi:streptogrisin B precursor [Actinomadura graeca]|uniref:Streptogrisin B n=1 Tax=Actinomadura graeca TaxID=2750812 RepID=A0ABX8R3K0_9ACTN|nr:S1 family peptidase [Actinomadura graeca]QXJ24282.1 streptogrisin B precursor [Actinomadura graeca]
MRSRILMTAAAVIALLAVPATTATASTTTASTTTASTVSRATAAPGGEGGRPVFAGGGVRCTLGFNVRKGGDHHFLTAGGCAKTGLKIYGDPALTIELGTVVAVTANAVALVRYVEPQVERPGSVHTHPGSQDITAADVPAVGRRVCRSGPITGMRCGSVTAVGLTVNFPEGTMTGLARTTICAEPGDTAGAPYFSGSLAVGLGVGGSGTCGSGGTSYFQPVGEVLSAFGVSVY